MTDIFFRYLFIGGAIILGIMVVKFNLSNKESFTKFKEPFTKLSTKLSPANISKLTGAKRANNINKQTSLTTHKQNSSLFHPTTAQNPLGNVLLTDISDTPDRLAAAPAFNPHVYDDIMESSKQQTQILNSSIEDTDKQIYGGLTEKFELDNSMRNFYSTANTRVTNNQGSYAQFLYGNMYSGKEATPEGAMMRVKDTARYLLI